MQACCERVRAACVIQAVWRGHVTRNRIKNLPRAVGLLQRKYRSVCLSLSTCLSVPQHAHLSVSHSVCLLTYLHVCLSICLPLCLRAKVNQRKLLEQKCRWEAELRYQVGVA